MYRFILLLAFIVLSVPVCAATGDKGPSFSIGKVSFKSVHPDVKGFSVSCVTSKVKTAFKDFLSGMGQGMGLNLVTMGDDKTHMNYFDEDPARRIKSEATSITVDTATTYDVNVSEAKSWFCTLVLIGKGQYQSYIPGMSSGDAAATSGASTYFLSGVF